MSVDEGQAEMAKVLGYAQARAIVVRLLGGPPCDPEALVTLQIRRLEIACRLHDLHGEALTEALLAGVREDTRPTIIARARTGNQIPTPWRTASHPLVFGTADWFELVIDAGGRAVPIPPDDVVIASTHRLAALAFALAHEHRSAARRRQADTERITRPSSDKKGPTE